ncbi:hypothetical protein J1N35_021932 [Gossypium stocksii]|uniref:Uncharacterized protein n=1 Tax=Gossypium stocksii TaxID=47602 RepID=A0A9D3VG68_9ROSI|nr:hypothetical protein J1N35_021932 [Gossypium stocksii]
MDSGKISHPELSKHPNLNMQENTLLMVKNLGILPIPSPIRHNARRSYLRDRCAFHQDEGHKTEYCSSLKDAIEEADRNGELKDFVAQRTNQPGYNSKTEAKGKQEMRGIINVIIGTNEDWATSNAKRKAHFRSIMSVSSPKIFCQQEK